MMSTLVLEKISESIRAGEHHDLHCHSMSLCARNKEMPRFQGPGAIRIESGGNLRFTMYADSLARYPLADRAISGDLIPDDSIYRLSAIDGNETEWISDKVPEIHVQPSKGRKKALITGDLIDVHSRQPTFPEGFSAVPAESFLTLYVFDKVDIPLNTKRVTEEKVDGEDFPRAQGAKLNIAKVEAADYKFEFTRHDDLLEIKVEAPTLRAGVHKRVIEALQFVLARPTWWMILCEESGDTTFTRIRSAPMHSARQTHFPPVQWVAFYDETDCVWALYAKYFQYILAHDEHSWHPLSRYLHSAIEAQAAGFDTYRLALGVAVEGILKTTFKTVYLKQLGEPRAYDQLRTLKELKVITDDELRAWKKLRNKTAHADRPDRLPSQRELDELSKVTTLMHKLVFQAIRYSGKYTDYGTRGFPTRDYVSAQYEPGSCAD